jgi:hypothetical protein
MRRRRKPKNFFKKTSKRTLDIVLQKPTLMKRLRKKEGDIS